MTQWLAIRSKISSTPFPTTMVHEGLSDEDSILERQPKEFLELATSRGQKRDQHNPEFAKQQRHTQVGSQ